jgi:NADPH:quinone reductase-like Zn-dependent oxidoreductase
VRNPDLRDVVAAMGAAAVGTEEWQSAGPYDVILELVGAVNMGANLAALATGGRIVVIGVGAGATAEINLLTLMACRGSIHASTLRPRPLEEKAIAARLVERHVLPLLAAGTVRVPVAATFPLEQTQDAYERFAAGAKFGKVVVLP